MTEETKEYIRGYKAALSHVLLLLKDYPTPRAVLEAINILLKD